MHRILLVVVLGCFGCAKRAAPLPLGPTAMLGDLVERQAKAPGVECGPTGEFVPFLWPREAGMHVFPTEQPPAVDGDLWEGANCVHVVQTTDMKGQWRVDTWSVQLLMAGEPAVVASEGGLSPAGQQRGVVHAVLRNGDPVLWIGEYMSSASLTHFFGDDAMHLMATGFSGGAHCCDSISLWRLAPGKPMLLLDLPWEEFPGEFSADAEGNPILVQWDEVFAYWPASFAGSPRARVVLRVDRSGDTPQGMVDVELTRRPAPSNAQFNAAVAAARAKLSLVADADISRYFYIPGSLYQPMVEYCYSGHPELAWRLLTEAWPEERSGRDAFGDNLQDRLDESDYYPQLPWASIRWQP